jgi:colicin import membrane protein
MNEQTKSLADLIVIKPKDALETFSTPGALDPILALVRSRIDQFEADVSTPAGRKQIASMAFSIAKSKTALEAIGERLAKEAKELPKKIDAGRKYAKDTLDKWRDEVRAPLTEWEAAEDARTKRHADAIAEIKRLGEGHLSMLTADGIVDRIGLVETLAPAGGAREEFAEEYDIAQKSSLRALNEALIARRKYDADQAELAELRRLKAENEAREAAERAAREAEARKKEEADRIAAEAEKAAQRERDAATAREAEAKAKAEADAKREADAAAAREADLKAQAEAAERRAREAEETARRELEAKAEEERKAQAKRAADRSHRAGINARAAAALVVVLAGKLAPSSDADEVVAKAIITAIAKGEIPQVTINY